MANVTIATTDAWLPEYWSTLIYDTLHDNTIMYPRLVDTRWEKWGRDGDTIHVPDIDEIAARTLTNMTGTITFDQATEGVTNIAINTLAYTAVKVDFAATQLNVLPVVDLYTDEIGRSVAEKLDTDIMTGLDGTTTVIGSDNVAVTDDLNLLAKETLDKNKVKQDDRVYVMSAESHVDNLKVDIYRNSLYGGTSPQLKQDGGMGYVGNIYGGASYMTTNVPAGASGHKNFYYHKSGIAVVVNKSVGVRIAEPHDEPARLEPS